MNKKITYTKHIYSLDELDEYLSAKRDLQNCNFVSYIWHEYGFFPIYLNELFDAFFADCANSNTIACCFAGQEFFYKNKVDELLILEGFVDTSRAYTNNKETTQFIQNLSEHDDRNVAFWRTIVNFNQPAFARLIAQQNFERELHPIDANTTKKHNLFPGPREGYPFQYASHRDGKEYWLPKYITPWQTERNLGWNLKKWQAFNSFAKIIEGEYVAIFVKNSWKTRDYTGTEDSDLLVGNKGGEGKPGFGFVSAGLLRYLIDHITKKGTKVVVIHDLVEYKLADNPLLEVIRMEKFFDTERFLSVVHHAQVFISSATSPIDLASYYCNTHLILLDDRTNKQKWVHKVSKLRGKQSLTCGSVSKSDAHELVELVTAVQRTTSTDGNRKLHIGGTEESEGWEVLNNQLDDYVDHLCDASDLSRFNEKSFNTIYCSHTLEHLSYVNDLTPTLLEWNRVLKDDGEILLSVPDLEVLTKLFSQNDKLSGRQRFNLMRIFYGGQQNEADYRRAGFSLKILKHFCHNAGLRVSKSIERHGIFNDASNATIAGELISLNVIIKKQPQ